MAAVKNAQIENEYNLFGRIWTVYKRFYGPEDNEGYWDALVETLKGVQHDFPGQLSTDLSMAILSDIERRYQERNK